MMTTRIGSTILALGIALVLTAATALAHHPFAPEFDWKKPVTLKGSITAVEWVQPHALVRIDVKNPAGATEAWEVELGNPAVLAKHYGFTRDVLKVNAVVTVDGWQARDGRRLVSAMTVTPSNGRAYFAASSFFDEPYRLTNGAAGTCVSDAVCVDGEFSSR